MPFCAGALVIPINHAVGFVSTVTDKHGMAGATEQLGSQNVGFRCFALALGVLILLCSYRNPLEQILGNDGGYAVWNHHIFELVFADVLAIGKYTGQRILVKAVSSGSADTSCIQILDDTGHGFTTGISAEHFDDYRCLCGIDL